MCQCNKKFNKSINARLQSYKKRSKERNEFIIFYVNEINELQVRIVKQGFTPNQVAKNAGWIEWSNILEYQYSRHNY
ncbi:hypothetical protein [uncultured Mediterranean phage uvMED]|nr:hypothetical protein [uncultured Mediterranean phage uvMED]